MTVLSLPTQPGVEREEYVGSAEFFARYHRPLLAYLRMGFRDSDVEAVAQETFCRALRHWPEVSQMRNPWPWLAVTARNLARNNIRDAAGSRAVGLRVCDSVADKAADLDEQVDATDRLRLLGRAMRSLTPLQRQLLRLLVEEGLTGAEAARRLGLTPGAGRMHLCRMRTRLTERFVGLGGQLGIAPVALIVAAFRRLRSGAATVRRSTGSAGALGTSVVAGSMVVATAGLVHVSLAPGGAGMGDRPDTRQMHTAVHEVAFHKSTPVQGTTTARAAGVQPPATNAPVSKLVPAVPAVPASHHVAVSDQPLDPGTSFEVGVALATPAGEVEVNVSGEQAGLARDALCSPATGQCH